MKTKTTKTKPRQYDYFFLFKKGNYSEVSSTLGNKFSKYFSGSGMSLLDGAFDISFTCSAEQAQKITQYIKRNFTCKAIRKRY
jgi:hypothetical protein